MKKISLLSALCSLLVMGSAPAIPLTGFYQTIDDEVKKPKSIVALYECEQNLCGRIVALYDVENGNISETLSNPVRIAEKVDGQPKMVGLDIIWNMEWDADDNRYENGKIMDPKKGSVYSSVIWADDADATKLRVRGKIGPFGRTQVWNVMNVSDLPVDLQKLDMKNWEPKVIK